MRKSTFVRRLAGTVVSSVVAAAFAFSVAVSPADAADKVRWKVPIAFPSSLPALGDNAPWVSELLKTASGGDIQLKVFEPGKLVPPFEIMQAVKDAKLQAGYTWIGYDIGKIPALALLGAVPFGMEPWEFMAWWYYGGGQQLAEELYAEHNVHPILCGLIPPETAGWFSFEIKSVDDFKGLKIRFAGLGGKVLQKLGASVTLLPAGELYQALEKGALDATEFSLPEIDQKLGFAKIVKNNYFPGWHQTFTSLHLIVNKKVWDELSAQSQAMLNMGCMAGVTNNLAKAEANQGPVIAGFPKLGVTPRRLSEDILRDLQKISKQVLEEESANDKTGWFKKIHDSQQAFSNQYSLWKQFGFLPRDF